MNKNGICKQGECYRCFFIYIEKAYDMLWKEGLLIKLEKLSIKGRMYNWIKEFLIGRSIRVKVGDGYIL